VSRDRWLLGYGRCSCDFYCRNCTWFPCISTQFSALSRTEVHTLSKIPGFTRIPWEAFSILCSNTYKSFIGAECTKVLRCPHSQQSRGLRSGDHAGLLNGPPRLIHCSPKNLLQVIDITEKMCLCPIMHEPLVFVVDQEALVPRVLIHYSPKHDDTLTPVGLLNWAIDPKCWSPKILTQTLARPYLSRHWFLDISWQGLFCSFKWVLYPPISCNTF
jgi:hypothetical protein